MPQFARDLLGVVLRRLKEPRRFIQVLSGPRQVGKTTLARQVIEDFGQESHHYASADDPAGRDYPWIDANWSLAASRARHPSRRGRPYLLVLDEVQKVPRWSETVKHLWDRDTAAETPLKVLLLGSSPLLIQRGLGESLAGRFETIRVPHWSLSEMRSAFGWDLETYLYYGGYPGAAALTQDEQRWRSYILDSLVETTLSRDILLMTRVDKPALLRQLFRLAADYSSQIVSYQKMVGQLQDAGNTTTLAHYLQLLAGASLVDGIQKFSGSQVRKRSSSPKLVMLNNALITATSRWSFEESKQDPQFWGRLVETAVGAHFLNWLDRSDEVLYWRDRNREVDFVIKSKGKLTAVEVKSGALTTALPGMNAFNALFGPARNLLIGAQGLELEEFLTTPPGDSLG